MSLIDSVVELSRKVNARKSEMSLPERKAWEEFQSKNGRDALLAMTPRDGDLVGSFLQLVGILIFYTASCYLQEFLIKQEMANLLMRENHHDPKLMGILSKYFYAEKVYDDLSDEPKLRWRRRTFFHESNATFEATESPYEHAPQSPNVHKPDQKRVPAKETNPRRKPAPMNNAVEVVENPFECIFGTVESEEIHGSRSNATPKRHGTRQHHHRRHRKHHHETSEAV